MEYIQLLAYVTQGIKFALTLVTRGSQAHDVLSQIDASLTAMQADGNRAPNEEERASLSALLDQLAAQPPQA